MQRLVFPLKSISISQRYHESHKAWDLNGEDTGIDYWYAPCRVKVLAIFDYTKTGFYNTVIFGSCDELGNPEEVMLENGEKMVLSFSCTHMDSLNKFGLAVGKIYQSGERCYCEGNTGVGSTGNHVHMGVAKDWQNTIVKYSDGNWYMPNIMNPANVFVALKDFNTLRNPNGYTFMEVDSREVEEETINYSLRREELNTDLRVTAFLSDKPITVKEAYDKFNTETCQIQFISAGQYFINKTSLDEYGQFLGRILGDNVDEAPDQNSWIHVAVQTDNNEVHWGTELTSGDWRKPWARFSFSPVACLISGGVYSNVQSTAVSDFSFTNKNRYVFIIQDWCDKLGIGVTHNKVTPNELREHFLADKDIRYLWVCDGGGSAVAYDAILDQLVDYSGENRKVPVFYALVKDVKNPIPDEPVIQEPPTEEPTQQQQPEPTEEYTTLGKLLIEFLKALIKLLFRKKED